MTRLEHATPAPKAGVLPTELHPVFYTGDGYWIQTSVRGFADRCLITRPSRHYNLFSYKGLNLYQQNQNLLCYHYTIREFIALADGLEPTTL